MRISLARPPSVRAEARASVRRAEFHGKASYCVLKNKKTAPERSSCSQSGLGAGPKWVSGCVGPAIFHNYARNDVSD